MSAGEDDQRREVQAALRAGTLVDVTSVLAPGGPVKMVAPVINVG
jgi:hypothetical protein